jgi:hypothetical protein
VVEKGRRVLVGARIASERVDQVKLVTREKRLRLSRRQYSVLQVAVQRAPDPRVVCCHHIRSHPPRSKNVVFDNVRGGALFTSENVARMEFCPERQNP